MSTEHEVQRNLLLRSLRIVTQVRSDDWTDPDISHMDIGSHREGSVPCKLSSVK